MSMTHRLPIYMNQTSIAVSTTNANTSGTTSISTTTNTPASTSISSTLANTRSDQAPSLRMINNTLRSESVDENVPKHLPKTIVDLVTEHRVLGFANLMHTKLIGWPRSKKVPFLRRTYIYQKVQARAPHYISDPSSLTRAAQQMDFERKSLGKSVYQ